MAEWIRVCPLDDIDPEDVIRFDHGSRTFAVYRDEDGTPHATDGLCTHEEVHLADGLVLDGQIECPKHNGRFCIRSGKALRSPVYTDLASWPARVTDGHIEIEI